jgi:hypothetical protein
MMSAGYLAARIGGQAVAREDILPSEFFAGIGILTHQGKG